MAETGKPANRLLRWLRRDPAGAFMRRGIEVESYALRRTPAPDSAVNIVCPSCDAVTDLRGYTCSECGFPFICDITPTSRPRPAQRWRALRQYMGIIAAVLWLLGSTLLTQSNDEFNGITTKVISQIAPALDSGITLSGPLPVVERTELALGLLKQRAPDYYFRMCHSVKDISYMSKSFLEGPAGRKIQLEGIGAVSTPEQRLVQVLYVTAFPGGTADLYDRDVFIYAGVLVHELRHIELHYMGTAPGGWREEVLCEQAAYDALKYMDAPKGVLMRYELYFRDPLARPYQRWYKWYEQWK
jgi:hypothetical protein